MLERGSNLDSWTPFPGLPAALAMISFEQVACCMLLQTMLVTAASDGELLSIEYETLDEFSTLARKSKLRYDRLAGDVHDKDRKDKLIHCASAPPGAADCFDTIPPEEFVVRFWLANGKQFSVRIFREWAPVFAQRFWQTSNLNWWEDMTIYRNVYLNSSFRFVSQFGWSGIPEVHAAWSKWKSSNATAPALKSNTRGTLSFSMGAVMCKSGDQDPCAPLRPNCTAHDYCAFGWNTEVYVNYKDNSHLDSHGFAPFGQVEESDLNGIKNSDDLGGGGMRVVDDVGERLGRKYGEVTDLCPAKPSADTSPFCVYRNGTCAGVNLSMYGEHGNEYIAENFAEMYLLRIVRAEVIL